MVYAPERHSRLSGIAQTMQGYCGGFAVVFIGTMRANGVPARSLVGHWVDTTPGHTATLPHVKAEFFAEGVGWVPVNPRTSFGEENGDFITFHVEGGFQLPTSHWGIQEQGILQGIYLPAFGRDTGRGIVQQDWIVSRRIPIPAAAARTASATLPREAND